MNLNKYEHDISRYMTSYVQNTLTIMLLGLLNSHCNNVHEFDWHFHFGFQPYIL